MSKKTNKLKQHRIRHRSKRGFHFEFSDPKSVPMQGTQLSGEKVFEAHNKAVEETIKYMESMVRDAQRRHQ